MVSGTLLRAVAHPILVENVLPDFMLRCLTRRMLAAQLGTQRNLTPDEQLANFITYAESLKKMEIAPEAEGVREIYEIPVDILRLFLGDALKFSTLYFKENTYSPEQAANAMHELYCERAQVTDGQHILDLGGGYGSFALYLAKRFPSCHITCVSYSKAQKEFIERECSKLGLTRVTAIHSDVSTFQCSQTFDRVFAIQLLEHLKNYEMLLKKVQDWMKEDSLLFIECMGHKQFAFSEGIDLGGFIPSETFHFLAGNLLLYFQEDLVVKNHWQLSGIHQSRSSQTWLENFDKNIAAIRKTFTEIHGETSVKEHLAFWRNLFLVTSEMFGLNSGHEWLVSHFLFKSRH